MNGGEPLRRTVVVANPMGLHMRPATAFARAAQSSGYRVTVYNGSKQADGSRALDLIMLVALPGAELVLEVDGTDDQAVAAAEQLASILAAEYEND